MPAFFDWYFNLKSAVVASSLLWAKQISVVSLRFRKDSILIMDDKYRHLRERHESHKDIFWAPSIEQIMNPDMCTRLAGNLLA